ncbi:MAG: M20/M25/M40 family metallo-hydrolase [Thermoplasmata archaeon]|nr:M20/M25/M40 family metallo-hydrolase [Thermoplasmata archaeon]
MDEATALLRLLRRYSPSGSEGPAVCEFVRLARDLGYVGRVDAAGNGIARRGRGSPRIVYLGHIDTVSGRRPVYRRGGRVYGRGAVDAKGPLAAALLAGATFDGPGTFEVIGAVGEEAASPGARHLAGRRGPDAVIAGEPSRWDGITIGYKGDLRLTARFRGQRTHYSSPQPTVADTALRWVESVRALPMMTPGASPFRSLTLKVVGVTTGGDDAEWAVVTLDLRIPPRRTTAEVLRALPSEPGDPLVRPFVRIEPIEVDRTNPVIRALEQAVRTEGGLPTLWRKSGTSDLNLVAPAWRVAGAAYGPGDPHLDHTAREWVSERELGRSVRILRAAVGQLAHELADTGRTVLPRETR